MLRVLARLVSVWVFGLRVAGRENWPAEGGGLVCANHQSMFDPPLVGLTCSRRMNYLARDTLFRVPGLKQLIAFLDAIPIDREGRRPGRLEGDAPPPEGGRAGADLSRGHADQRR